MAGGTGLRSLNSSFYRKVVLLLATFIASLTLLFALLISMSVGLAEDYILRAYLQNEQQEYLSKYTASEEAPLPATSYLFGYKDGDYLLPEAFRSLKADIYELNPAFEVDSSGGLHLLITPLPDGKRLYLLLDEHKFSPLTRFEDQVRLLAFAVGLGMTLLGMLLVVWIARMISQPVLSLAADLQEEPSASSTFHGTERQDEVGILSRALTDLVARLTQSLQTEKAFTRHASHELRTPLGTIRNALAVLQLPGCASQVRERNLQRIERACLQSEKITQAFLLLGNSQQPVQTDQLDLAMLVSRVSASFADQATAQGIELQQLAEGDVCVQANPALLEVLLDNLFRNGISYGEDYLQISISPAAIVISNPVRQAGQTDIAEQHYGYGLEIVRRICERCGWQLDISRPDGHFRVAVSFIPQQ